MLNPRLSVRPVSEGYNQTGSHHRPFHRMVRPRSRSADIRMRAIVHPGEGLNNAFGRATMEC